MQTTSRPNLEQLDDHDLIARCLEGDEFAWEALIRRYQRLVYSIPIRYGLGEEVASDVFQAVCLLLLEHLSALKDTGKLASWLITTTSRECWRVAHRLRREAPMGEGGEDGGRLRADVPDERPLAEAEQIQLAEQHRVRVALEGASERCRTLLQLLYFAQERPSYEEISRRIGIPVPSIGPTRARCLEKLRRMLE